MFSVSLCMHTPRSVTRRSLWLLPTQLSLLSLLATAKVFASSFADTFDCPTAELLLRRTEITFLSSVLLVQQTEVHWQHCCRHGSCCVDNAAKVPMRGPTDQVNNSHAPSHN